MSGHTKESRFRASCRGAGGAVGAFGLFNLIGDIICPGFSANFMWITAPAALVGVAGAFLLANAWRPLRGRLGTVGGLAVLCLAALAWLDVISFGRVVASGRILTSPLIPGSGCVALLLSVLGFLLLRESPAIARRWLPMVAGFVAVLVLFPLLFILTFGSTRYARAADCAVVLGARVYDDGTPSLALADRTDEGIRLYQAGFVNCLVMSGGVDPRSGHSEAKVMRDRALAAGVPVGAIVLDEAGNNTAATVRNTSRIMRRRGLRTVLAVSHYYHQPRLKVLFARTNVDCYTVPAHMSRRLLREPYFVAREIAAFYHSLLRETPRNLAAE